MLVCHGHSRNEGDMTDKIIKDRFSISQDELEHRQQMQEKHHNEPVQKAVAILEAAVDTVLKKLGVDVTRDDVAQQMDLLGIIMCEEAQPEMAGVNGFFIYVTKKGEIIPYGWIGAAQLNSVGECSCEIHWFQDERLIEVGGGKLQ